MDVAFMDSPPLTSRVQLIYNATLMNIPLMVVLCYCFDISVQHALAAIREFPPTLHVMPPKSTLHRSLPPTATIWTAWLLNAKMPLALLATTACATISKQITLWLILWWSLHASLMSNTNNVPSYANQFKEYCVESKSMRVLIALFVYLPICRRTFNWSHYRDCSWRSCRCNHYYWRYCLLRQEKEWPRVHYIL